MFYSKKSLGQNFLIDKNIIKKIINVKNIENKDVVEIGPGNGALTNQILNFTKEVKNMNEQNKIQIIEALWRIIYSNKEADIYETSLMRRLGGLLYVDNKVMGDIKEKIKSENL